MTPYDFHGAPLGARFFFRLLLGIARRLKFGTLRLVMPNGEVHLFQGSGDPEPHVDLFIHDLAVARRVVMSGDIGFFESYADGHWSTSDLSDCLYLLARNADEILDVFPAQSIFGLIEKLRHGLNRNSVAGSRRNISAHYDLGNAFYEKWLDPSMTYSSALFVDKAHDLAAAQEAKYAALAQAIDLRPGETVLEIGSGWGGFAEFAAREIDAKVTGLTISREQFDFARARIQREGLGEKVDIRLVDYRDADGTYDKIASIEMVEAVGREYWPVYFSRLRDRLKPGGVAGLQVITIADRMYEHYARSVDFIQRFIFPGGFLPSPQILRTEIERAGLVWRDAQGFGDDYARTLAEWRSRFENAWHEIQPLGFDDRFRKTWNYYLAYCEAGFRAKTTDVYQVSAARD